MYHCTTNAHAHAHMHVHVHVHVSRDDFLSLRTGLATSLTLARFAFTPPLRRIDEADPFGKRFGVDGGQECVQKSTGEAIVTLPDLRSLELLIGRHTRFSDRQESAAM